MSDWTKDEPTRAGIFTHLIFSFLASLNFADQRRLDVSLVMQLNGLSTPRRLALRLSYLAQFLD